jgi:hypothetical protein
MTRPKPEMTLNADEPHIFPTCHRGKHGKSVNFPVGAEILSRALDGVPQHALIGCHFTVGDMERRPVKDLEHVMHVVYSRQLRAFHHAQSADERGVFDPKWAISVFAVPSTLRHPIRTLLIKDALPNIVRPWLIANGNVTGRTGSRALTIMFNSIEGVLTHETHDKLMPDRV